MTRKPKPPVRAERVRAAAKRHPWITWTTAASIAGVLSVAGPLFVQWLGHYQTVPAAQAEAEKLRVQIAWLRVGQLRTDTLLLRNRVNECDARAAMPKPLSPEEVRNCKQYQREFDDSSKRYEEAVKEARTVSK